MTTITKITFSVKAYCNGRIYSQKTTNDQAEAFRFATYRTREIIWDLVRLNRTIHTSDGKVTSELLKQWDNPRWVNA